MPKLTERLQRDEKKLASHLSKTIRKTRKEREMSQAQMADLMGTSQDMISRFENGERVPTLLNWLSFCAETGVDPFLPLQLFKDCKMPGNGGAIGNDRLQVVPETS